jgi:hypothetical protein
MMSHGVPHLTENESAWATAQQRFPVPTDYSGEKRRAAEAPVPGRSRGLGYKVLSGLD